MKKNIFLALLMVLPYFVSAQEQLKNVEGIVGSIGDIVNLLIPIVFALALLYFFWGLAKYILASGEGKEEGRNTMIWGVVALFVMASIWGIVRFIQSAFNIDNENPATQNAPGIKKQ